MKEYEKPVVEIIDFQSNEPIMGSGGITDGPSLGGGTGAIPGM